MARKLSKELRKKYPKLAKELGGEGTVKVQAVRSNADVAEKTAYNVEGYEPTAVDFIRRCENEAQAREIIDFLEGKGKIEPDYAKQLRSQLTKHGLKSFGKRKEPGCYERGEMG